MLIQKLITVSVSPVESVLPYFFKVTDVTLTESRNKTYYFQKLITVSVSPVESVLPYFFKDIDVTLTENKNKNKFF